MSSVGVSTLVPHQAVIEMPKSTSKHVIRRRQVEILPLENTSFAYSSNDSIKFNISSSTELLDGMNSYIKMTLTCTGPDTRVLDVGGAHALFREIELRTQNGTLIQRYDRYNRWYAMMSSATHSPQHVEVVEAAAGDSVDYKDNVLGVYESTKIQGGLTYTSLANVAVSAANVLTLDAGGNATQEVEVGDILVVGVAANTWTAQVASITDNNTIVLVAFAAANNRNLPAAGIAAGSVLSINIVKKNGGYNNYQSQRAKVAQTASVPLVFKPAVSFLQMKQWIPLAFIKQGLQLELKLDRPEYVMNMGVRIEDAAAATALDYSISSPRYVADMITADESIMAQYLQQFNGSGIHMSILGYRFARKTVDNATTGTEVVNHMFGVRSARHVFTVIQASNISETVNSSTKTNFSLSTFIRANVSSYQYKSGSEEYPMRAVPCDTFNTEAFSQLMLSTNQHGGTLWNVRFSPREWRSENSLLVGSAEVSNTATNNSTKFIMATRLDRNDDNFTGLDLSLNPLDLEINISSANDTNLGNLNLYTWVGHDILVSLSSDGLVIRK